MAQHDCYTLASNPHTAGTRSHTQFETAFNEARFPSNAVFDAELMAMIDDYREYMCVKHAEELSNGR